MQKPIRSSILIGLVVVSALVTRVFAVDQIKTIDVGILGSASQVSSRVDTGFSLYIGDNISGVTTPVKSVYVTVSGVYTGGGSLQLMLDSNAGTSQTFTLPAVGNPTPFEILYHDTSNYINPISPGTYSYTLNVLPNSVTISALGAKATATYQYTPPACQDGASANEKIKTVEMGILGSASQISSRVDPTFSLYIGDNISGVTTPVKSVYVTVSGVYTGGGSLQLMLDSNAGTSQTFTLPAVGNPTPFEILYHDTSNYINPISPGTYSYTLNVLPNSVTISALGAKATATYRYKPPACGGGYPPTGDVTSAVFDSTVGGAYNSLLWKGTLGGPLNDQGKVRFQFATSDSSSGPWNFIGGATCASGDWYNPGAQDTPVEITCASQYHNNQRYYKYKVQICSQDCSVGGTYTPTVNDVVVSWTP